MNFVRTEDWPKKVCSLCKKPVVVEFLFSETEYEKKSGSAFCLQCGCSPATHSITFQVPQVFYEQDYPAFREIHAYGLGAYNMLIAYWEVIPRPSEFYLKKEQ